MIIQIRLTPDVESGLATLARMKGLPLDEYIRRLFESLAIQKVPEPSDTTPTQRAKKIRHWAEQFPYRRWTSLRDDAISRESIYDRAGNE